jgi:hypothetical protein
VAVKVRACADVGSSAAPIRAYKRLLEELAAVDERPVPKATLIDLYVRIEC